MKVFEYCQKTVGREPGYDPVVYGTPLDSGTGGLVQPILDAAAGGKRLRQILTDGATAEISAKFLRYTERVVADASILAAEQLVGVRPVVEFHWGDSATGKSEKCRAEWLAINGYPCGSLHESAQCWVDNLAPCQKAVHLEDWDFTLCPFRTLIKILSGEMTQLPMKGGLVAFCPTHVFISSNVLLVLRFLLALVAQGGGAVVSPYSARPHFFIM